MVVRMAGEELHELGAQGARRAKRWLDRTTRADARWVTPDRVAVPKLTFEWADGSTFSFDLGGLLLGEALDGQEFLAEVKYYTSSGAQGKMYEEYLAKCYRAYSSRPDRCDNFMWITWAPFSVTSWATLCDAETVRTAVLQHRQKSLGVDDVASAEAVISGDLVAATAERLWLIVLSRRQEEQLQMSARHLALIRQHEIEQAS